MQADKGFWEIWLNNFTNLRAACLTFTHVRCHRSSIAL